MDLTAFIIPLTVFLLFHIFSSYKNYANDRVWKKRNASSTIILFVFLFLLSALRSTEVGADTSEYYDLYITIASADKNELLVLLTRFEAGFVYIVKGLTYISDSPQLFFVLSSLIIFIFLFDFFKKYSPYALLSLFLFFFLRYHDEFMNVTRQAIAISLLLQSYKKLKENKTILFVVFVVFASFIHKSSIVFLLAWPITKIVFKKHYLPYILLGWTFFFVAGTTISSYLISSGIVNSYYEDSDYLSGGKIAPFVMMLMDIIVFLICLKSKTYYNVKYKSMQLYGSDMMWFLVVGIFFDTLNLSFAILTRVAWIFTFYKVLIIPYIVVKLKPNTRSLFMVCLQSFLILYYYVTVIYKPEWNPVYPYTTFFNI